MKSYVTQEYDFHEAIIKNLNLESSLYKNFHILDVENVLNNSAIVSTTHGKFYCETWENNDAEVL